MKLPLPDELEAALRVHRWVDLPSVTGRVNNRPAAILVPLRWDLELECVLTERSEHLREHPSEICFPGGRPEPEDQDLAATALREAFEETGVPRASRVLGRLSSVPLVTSDYRLVPYVADASGTDLVANPAEVERVIPLTIGPLLETEMTLAIPYQHEGREHLAPIFEVDDRVVFGGTAYALYELLTVISAWQKRAAPPLIPSKYQWSDVIPR